MIIVTPGTVTPGTFCMFFKSYDLHKIHSLTFISAILHVHGGLSDEMGSLKIVLLTIDISTVTPGTFFYFLVYFYTNRPQIQVELG